MVSRPVAGLPPSFALLRVKDPLQALQQIGHQVLLETKVKVVGITGSVGKTTTKDMTAAFLSSAYRVIKSEKNYNNEIGLPLTLLRLSPGDEILVAEMAMRAAGDIKKLTEIAPPDVAVITRIAPVHLEFFSSLEGIALAKKEILDGAKDNAIAVLNGDDPWIMKIASTWKRERLLFGLSPNCDVRASSIRKKGFQGHLVELRVKRQQVEIEFPYLYEGFIYNLLAACAVAHILSIPLEKIATTAASLIPPSGRARLICLSDNIYLVDDTYNSNPQALEEALRSLSSLPAARHLAVLGDMLELGPEAPRFHQLAGKNLVELGWDYLITIGPLAREIARGASEAGLPAENIFSFSNIQEANHFLDSFITRGDLILIKGSRAMGLEKIVEHLKQTRGGN